jgi:hypothetical protein
MGNVTLRVKFFGACLPPLAAFLTVAAYFFELHRGEGYIGALVDSIIGGVVCLFVNACASPSTEEECDPWYLGEEDASNIAAVRTFAIMGAPLIIIALLLGSALQAGLIAMFVLTGLVLSSRYVEANRTADGNGHYPRGWLFQSVLLPAGLVMAFFVDTARFLSPEKHHPAATGVLAVFLIVYLTTTIMPWLPKTEYIPPDPSAEKI